MLIVWSCSAAMSETPARQNPTLKVISMNQVPESILLLKCPDRPGVLAEVTPFLASQGCDIRDSTVFGDPDTETFFIRMHLTSPEVSATDLRRAFEPVARRLKTDWVLHDLTQKMRAMLCVSKSAHCLNDLLFKWQNGTLPIDIVGILSNHADLEPIATWHNIPYHHLPISKESKPQQEKQFRALIEEKNVDLVVLARYMQILSDQMCAFLEGRCINIHHSFLPSFKGARPYHQAYERGVKIIGATAHYVTTTLDEGPIIEQDVRRVTHATVPKEMIRIGHEVEAQVLSRAVRWHAEYRVLLNGTKTVVLN